MTFPLTGDFARPETVFIVEWKNWAQDCHAETVWDGVLINGNKLNLEWQVQKKKADGTIVVGKKSGHDTFYLQP
jgi:hypothetical protein